LINKFTKVYRKGKENEKRKQEEFHYGKGARGRAYRASRTQRYRSSSQHHSSHGSSSLKEYFLHKAHGGFKFSLCAFFISSKQEISSLRLDNKKSLGDEYRGFGADK
jgi:hypothetical protein